jgi:hypothetical protein
MAVIMIYIALLRSSLDYGGIAFGAAAQTFFKQLDLMQAQALRICCGVLRTSLVAAMQVELGELALTYWVNLQGHKAIQPTTKGNPRVQGT